jgi:ABC-2 type transport system permease protein
MNIFWREMRANWKSLAIWCAAQVFVIYAGMVKYSTYVKAKMDIGALFADFPPGLRAVFGIGEVDLMKIDGYYSIFFLFFMLLAGIQAVMLGALLIAKEERDHSADFLFAKPVLRSQVITAKLAAGLANIVIFNLLTLVSSLYFIGIYNEGAPITGKVIELMVALLILQVLFLCLGAALGALLKTARMATSVATGIMLATFFLAIAIDIDSRIEFLRFITPFSYFDAKSLIYNGSFEAMSLIMSLVLTVASVAVTYIQFGRRDLAV